MPYSNNGDNDSFGTYTDFSGMERNGIYVGSATLVTDAVVDGSGNVSSKTVKENVYYKTGETVFDENGNKIQAYQWVEEKTTITGKIPKETWTELPSRYEDGKLIVHIDSSYTDAFGNHFDDILEYLTQSFKVVTNSETHIIDENDMKLLESYNPNNLKIGDEIGNAMYLVDILNAKAKVYSNYDEYESLEDTYIIYVELNGISQNITYDDAGTREKHLQVLERPIRQKVKVVKDIQVMPESETYMHDTYSDVHTENIEGKENDESNLHVTDSLTKLLEGDVKDQSSAKIPGFRFKAYLKSNLERLYRNNDGDIIWTDRNGNIYFPTPKDTNGDGNYDTFTLVSGTEEIDFPEEHITSDGQRVSSNVQKLYTQVEHNTSSTTTGDNANNVWAEYGTPQGGDTSQVGELREDNTSLDGDNGEAVYTNGALYSYDGKNVNVKETDKINDEQNTGYTRLLETEVILMEDGAGKTRNVETYNYEKFFDAMAAANTDKWDNDMFTTYDGDGMNNYPGQNWFDTFDEKYQKDDRDPDHTPENVDGVDSDNTAGGDRNTSFKPFQWIMEHLFGTTEDTKNNYPKTDSLPDTSLAEDAIYNAAHDNNNLENEINTSEFAHINSEASDAVRQFAIKWYLDDEVAKLVKNNGYDEDIAIAGSENYQEEVYDLALYNALEKTYNYIRPFYNYDLDTIYSVEWDSAVDGGSDNDITTLSADTLSDDKSYYYGASAYLPYGTYVVVEQQPYSEALDDFDNKSYKTDKPKEVVLPSVYEENGNETSPEILDDYYNYSSTDSPEKLDEKYFIRFNEEWAPDKTEDQRPYVIRAHNNDGDFEVYKYGLDVDKLTAAIDYLDGSYDYDGFKITQEQFDPLKDYYNDPVVDTKINGGNPGSEYIADNDNPGKPTASGNPYATDAIEARYHYGSISENSGTADDVLYPNGPETDDNNPSGYYFKDNVKTMTGNQTAYEGKYASMLVPWSVVEPAEETSYDITNFTGYADMKMRNTFYTTKLRIEKLDSETGENIVHDDAIFSIYAASRYTSRDEIEDDSDKILDPAEKAEFLELTEIGDVKFYLQDTQITGSYEFLTAMGARDITPAAKGRSAGVGELWTGIVSEGTPVCLEEEQIIMQDMLGNKTGLFKVYATLNDIEMLDEDATDPDDKTYMDQNVGYVVTPQPLGAGVYVLVETKAPAGYVRSKPVAIEVYSDSVSYYANGLINTKVDATIYQGNLITDK